MEPQERTHELEERAAGLADGVVEKIASFPREYAQHQQFLYDLKTELIELCARPVTRPGARDGIPGDDLKWELARNMPDFSTESLYQKRSSFLSMGGIVFFGYLLGGLLSTVLGWLGMGGDIIRVVTPGTVIESSMLQDDKNNYIASIFLKGGAAGLCFADAGFSGARNPGEIHCGFADRHAPADLLGRDQTGGLWKRGRAGPAETLVSAAGGRFSVRFSVQKSHRPGCDRFQAFPAKTG
mgnify:CR=1 FL=1